MRLLQRLRLGLVRFGQDERGSTPIEGLLAFVFLSWWYVASYQFVDALRQKTITVKAAYTLADMLSRETGPNQDDPSAAEVNQTYVNGLNTVFDYLTNSRFPTWIRVTSAYYDGQGSSQKYRVDWSATSGTGRPVMTTPMLQAYANKLPEVPNGDTLIIVETFLLHEPPIWYKRAGTSAVDYGSGLQPTVFDTFIVTAPRFASCVPWMVQGCGTTASGDWIRNDNTDPEEDNDPET